MGAVVQERGVLHGKHQPLGGYALAGRFIMGLQQSVHAGVRMLKETISGFGSGASLTGLRQVGLRPRVKIPRQDQQPLPQPRIAQGAPAELFLRPVGRRGGGAGAAPPKRWRACACKAYRKTRFTVSPAGVLPVLPPRPVVGPTVRQLAAR